MGISTNRPSNCNYVAQKATNKGACPQHYRYLNAHEFKRKEGYCESHVVALAIMWNRAYL